MRRLCGPFQSSVGISEPVSRRSPVRSFALAATMLLVALTQARMAMAQMDNNSYAPYAQNDLSMTMEETPVLIAVLNNDYSMPASLNPASIHIISAPRNGVAAVETSTGQVWYFPNTEFSGMDLFTYTVANSSGITSNIASVLIGVIPDATLPVIANLAASPRPTNIWRISGTVSDDDPAGVVVHFGGILAGESANVNADGAFYLDVYLGPGDYGMYSALALNSEGYSSTIVNGYIGSQ
jgi:hypothetical protein